MFWMCRLTVNSESPRRSAISLLAPPFATSPSTSSSRLESVVRCGAAPAVAPAPCSPLTSSNATSRPRAASPSTAPRNARRSPAGEISLGRTPIAPARTSPKTRLGERRSRLAHTIGRTSFRRSSVTASAAPAGGRSRSTSARSGGGAAESRVSSPSRLPASETAKSGASSMTVRSPILNKVNESASARWMMRCASPPLPSPIAAAFAELF